MSLARRLICEAVVVPSDTDAVMQIIMGRRRDVDALNAELEPYHIRFTDDDALLNRDHAMARADGEWIVVATRALRWHPAQLEVMVDHELVHRGQFGRATAQGKEVPPLADEDTAFSVDDYFKNKLELMAYARSMVVNARQQRIPDRTIEADLRSGRIRGVPPPILGLKRTNPELFQRFLKYAMAYLSAD